MEIDMKNFIYVILLGIYSSIIFGQSGGGNLQHLLKGGSLQDLIKNSSIMLGMNQSFYGEDWKDFEEELENEGSDLSNNNFRKINFTLMSQFDYEVLGGIKYLSYGYDFEIEGTSDYDYVDGDRPIEYYKSDELSYSLELNFLKLFLTYPMGSGLYVGLEGGYFMEGKAKSKFRSATLDGEVNEENLKNTFDRDDWENDGDLNSYDYGLIAQYFYTIKDNILFTTELYYSLSEFSEDNSMIISAVPNSFNYFNLGLTYKFRNKSK